MTYITIPPEIQYIRAQVIILEYIDKKKNVFVCSDSDGVTALVVDKRSPFNGMSESAKNRLRVVGQRYLDQRRENLT